VRFASECLAFANVPENATLARVPAAHGLRVHHALWRERGPRDLGAGWDFDDVRDHYLQRLFGLDPLALRYADHERYLELGRVVTGEVMAATFLEWRRARSVTRGGLVWFLRDFWPGAGWGVIDSEGAPKAAWYYLRRALAPLALSLSDEGVNGVAIHVVNDRPAEFRGSLELSLVHSGEVVVARATAPLTVAGASATELNAVTLLGDFHDVSYAYRFGPPSHDLVAATLRDEAGVPQSRAVHFIGLWPSKRERDVGLSAETRQAPSGAISVAVRARRFAQSVHLTLHRHHAADNYFHLLPGEEHTVQLTRAHDGPAAFESPGTVRALNSETGATIRSASPPDASRSDSAHGSPVL
jgi:beta-mannosidase